MGVRDRKPGHARQAACGQEGKEGQGSPHGRKLRDGGHLRGWNAGGRVAAGWRPLQLPPTPIYSRSTSLRPVPRPCAPSHLPRIARRTGPPANAATQPLSPTAWWGVRPARQSPGPHPQKRRAGHYAFAKPAAASASVAGRNETLSGQDGRTRPPLLHSRRLRLAASAQPRPAVRQPSSPSGQRGCHWPPACAIGGAYDVVVARFARALYVSVQ
jgi:hypothetical protein